ncbi:hypothetical protein [Candidatus Alkanophaga liquidiphilum]|nr:hypothetical protein [Candidatus Alkanophaga liquidiphilum]RLG38454.1 MAG: hypothetical protein DRN91_02675 [Candidatus Alkanophagales archaeon]
MIEIYGWGRVLTTFVDEITKRYGTREASALAYKVGEEVGARLSAKLLPVTAPEDALRTFADYVRPYIYIQVKRKTERNGSTEFEVSYPRCMVRTMMRGRVPGPLCRVMGGWIESALMGITGKRVKMETKRIDPEKNVCYGTITFE